LTRGAQRALRCHHRPMESLAFFDFFFFERKFFERKSQVRA
jgi:hypothetical protein